MKAKLLLALLFVGVSMMGQETKPASQADVQKVENKVENLKQETVNINTVTTNASQKLDELKIETNKIKELLSKKEERQRKKDSSKQAKADKIIQEKNNEEVSFTKYKDSLITIYKDKSILIDNLLKSEKDLLDKTKGDPNMTNSVLKNINLYSLQRDSIANYIKLLSDSKTIKKDLTVEKKLKNKVSPKEARYTYLNGINFDFNNDKTNYVGHFNVYVPAYYNEKNVLTNRWGINVGILKVNYVTRDSLVNYSTDNVLIHPLDVVAANGDTYNQQFNKYTTQTKVTSYSIYAQPMFCYLRQGRANFYVHGHLELLANKFEIATKITTLQTLPVTIDGQHPLPNQNSLIKKLDFQNSQTINLESSYFGAGGTFDFNFIDNCILFMQGTVGVGINVADRFPTKDQDGNYTITAYSKAQGFFLFRSYFQYNTSKATQVVIGTDIRGNLPNQPPYYSVYAGINLGLDQIFN